MFDLPNGCKCSELSVSPSNWDKAGAKIKKDWFIHYTFYDPNTEEKKKLCIVKRMNRYKTLQERRDITKVLLSSIRQILDEGFNPITKSIIDPGKQDPAAIGPNTPLIPALQFAIENHKVVKNTRIDIDSAFTYIEKSAIDLGIHNKPVKEVTRKYAAMLLNNCSKVKEYWSGHLFNHYRTYLMMMFNTLIQFEAIIYNPVDKHLPKEETEEKIRELLTDAEVNAILKLFKTTKPDPYYYRFIQIFFHSGSRPIELIKTKFENVNLEDGEFIVKCRKGKKWRETKRPIKNVARKYWEELIQEAKPGQYLFGNDHLKPGDQPSTRDYITKRWLRLVKADKENGGLGIKKDLYSLKHKNLDETAAYLSIKEAQKMADHQSPVVTMVYAVGEKKRENDRLKEVPNVLGG